MTRQQQKTSTEEAVQAVLDHSGLTLHEQGEVIETVANGLKARQGAQESLNLWKLPKGAERVSEAELVITGYPVDVFRKLDMETERASASVFVVTNRKGEPIRIAA